MPVIRTTRVSQRREIVSVGVGSPCPGVAALIVRRNSIAMDELDTAIREFTPGQGDWLPLEAHFQRAFASPDPKKYYPAIFNLFERFPEEDGAGVFWSALHGMEAVGGYEDLLLQHFRRWPSLMTKAMLRRILNSGQSHIGKIAITTLISE